MIMTLHSSFSCLILSPCRALSLVSHSLPIRLASLAWQILVKTPSDKEKDAASRWPTWGCEVSKFPWSVRDPELQRTVWSFCSD